MNWNDIQYFVTLVDEQTLTATADKLDVQHSTVARRIDKLEQSLGVQLFNRMGKRYHLTSEGELLFVQACEIKQNIQGFSQMAVNQNALQGNVTISVPSVLANELIVPKLPDFYQQYADIFLTIQGESRRSNLYQREADIALRIGRPTEEGLVIRKIMNIDYHIYQRKQNKTNKPNEVTKLIEFRANKSILDWTNQIKQAYQAQTILASNDLYMVQRAISLGIGVGALPSFMVKDSETLTPMEMSVDIASEQVFEGYLVMHPDVRRSPRVRAVAGWLGEVLGY